jgi:hypothetical protein
MHVHLVYVLFQSLSTTALETIDEPYNYNDSFLSRLVHSNYTLDGMFDNAVLSF